MDSLRKSLKKYLPGKWKIKMTGCKINIEEKLFPYYHVDFDPPITIKEQTYTNDDFEVLFGQLNDSTITISSETGKWYLENFSEVKFDLVPFNPKKAKIERCHFIRDDSAPTK